MVKNILSILEVSPETYKHFSCGRVELDEYLKRFAKGNHKKGIGKTFVLKEYHSVVGYYTISMGSIEFSNVPDEKKNGLPKYPIPIARIGRLAVNEKSQGNGIGKFLLIDALHKIYDASQVVAAYAIIVDAKDNNAKEFYKYFGFMDCLHQDLTLFLPMETIRQLLGQNFEVPSKLS